MKSRLLVCLVSLFTVWSLHATSLVPESLYKALPKDVTPQLSDAGDFAVGVSTLSIITPDQVLDLTGTRGERKLTLEVWYPASQKLKERASYVNQARSGAKFAIQGEAYRDAPVATSDDKFPIVVLSHGYTGYRTIMYYLGEHLASHGFVVVGIDHTGSTNEEVDFVKAPFSGFISTLLHRSVDQHNALDAISQDIRFKPIVNPQRAGLVGYSMGGFGAVNSVGGCYQFNAQAAAMFTGTQDSSAIEAIQARLNTCAGGHVKSTDVDPRWKAMVAMAPWGGQHQLFDSEALGTVNVPTLYIAGELDDISGYQGIRWLYENTGGEHVQLLTYANARHNIAPHPAPSQAMGNELDIGHYYEPAWSMQALNNINKHFVLAQMQCYVKQLQDYCAFLNVTGNSNQVTTKQTPVEPWLGFDNRYSTGMSMESKLPTSVVK